MEQRKTWWSFQPVKELPVPEMSATSGAHPVDRFLDAAQTAAGRGVAGMADRRTLIRRLSFVLTGLPPTAEDVEKFVNDPDPNAWNALVEAMLGSTAFGERWARHWMDWFRYAESHGSEGDPSIPFAWRYRDYLIRALNDDIPYNQLVREHIAGDLLEAPRLIDGHNESALGTAHYRMVQHGFAPTDALDELVRFTDNQIDVISKGFLGLTVSCARCHNHKFDAISQADFYAMFGVMASCRPATLSVDAADHMDGPHAVMQRVKGMIRGRLAAAWKTETVVDHLMKPEASWQSAIENATDPGNPLFVWNQLQNAEGKEFKSKWGELKKAWSESDSQWEQQKKFAYKHRWNLARQADATAWMAHGTGVHHPLGSDSPGEFHLHADGEKVVGGIFPGGLISHKFSTRDSAVFESPKVVLDDDFRVYVRVAGSGSSLARYVVRHYPRDGTVYPVGRLDGGNWQWSTWDLSYWKGDTAHIEVATAADSPVLGRSNVERSWVALSEVIFTRAGDPVPREHMAETTAPLFLAAEAAPPENAKDLAALYSNVIERCVTKWGQGADGALTDSEARFLDYFCSMNLLPNTLDGLPSVAPLVAEFRELEGGIDGPTRSPGVIEAEPVMQPLFDRGDHNQPGEPVPRRFLDAFGARMYPEGSSGRRELAEDIVDGNPLAARVIVNRLWHHVFGEGIVATADNFGRLGKQPTHPELLDYLAIRMRSDGWSLKSMLRLMVTSQAFQRASQAPAGVAERDPDNQLLTHWSVRRLEAEAIRDNSLSVSGLLDRDRFGPPADGKSGRRSVYVRVIRNALDPFLSVFDAPVPNSTQGVRDASNVPAQSLTMMNDPFVIDAARSWAEHLRGLGEESRIEQMFTSALGRKPAEPEQKAAQAFLRATKERVQKVQSRVKERQASLMQARKELAEIIEPVRSRLLAAKKQLVESGGEVAADLHPIAAWNFPQGVSDQIGSLDLELKGGAAIQNGELQLNGSGAFAVSSPLQQDLREKTLEAVVQLNDLNQGGGAAISIETMGGEVFDAIVFAEREPRKWMAGSNGFARTRDFDGGSAENEAGGDSVCIAIVYKDDGSITCYRNGEPYGKGYRADGPVTFEKGKAHILLGLRHSPSGDGRWLGGKISRARLYDRALTPEEIRASASLGGAGNYVSRAEVDAALTAESLGRRNDLEAMIAAQERELKQLSEEESSDPLQPWIDLAHSIFNLKEFIYLR
ncbi:MAG: DUF1553 domain-containing protein [Verrucomicrobiales bacterium]